MMKAIQVLWLIFTVSVGDTKDTVDNELYDFDHICCEDEILSQNFTFPLYPVPVYPGDSNGTVDATVDTIETVCCDGKKREQDCCVPPKKLLFWRIRDTFSSPIHLTIRSKCIWETFLVYQNVSILSPRIHIRIPVYPGDSNGTVDATVDTIETVCCDGKKREQDCCVLVYPGDSNGTVDVTVDTIETVGSQNKGRKRDCWTSVLFQESDSNGTVDVTVDTIETEGSQNKCRERDCCIPVLLRRSDSNGTVDVTVDTIETEGSQNKCRERDCCMNFWTNISILSPRIHIRIWAHHNHVKRETKDRVNNTNTDSSGYTICSIIVSIQLLSAIDMFIISNLVLIALSEYSCTVLFAICSITIAILLLTAITMFTISILVLIGWWKTKDICNCQEIITIRRKVKKFIKKIFHLRCENSSSAAEKQVVQALRTACKRQTFMVASKKQLGLEFLEAFSGSIIIRFVTEMGKSLQKIKDACATGKIREFLPNIFVGTGVESKLGEGDVMWKYFLYKEPCRSSGINVDTAQAAATEKQEEILNPIKLHWNLFVEELDPRKLYADLEGKGLLGYQDGIEMLKHVARKDRMVFLLERLNTLKEPGLGYEILLDHCRENDEYVLQKIMEKEELEEPQEQSTSTGCMSDRKLMFSATIHLSVQRKVSTTGMMKNTSPECDKEFEITCLDVLDPVCYFDNTGEDMEGDDELQEIVMKLKQIMEPEEEKKQPCLKRKRNM